MKKQIIGNLLFILWVVASLLQPDSEYCRADFGISAIIAALIAAAATTAAGVAQNKANKAAGEKAEGLAMISRGDTLKQQKIVNKQNDQQLQLAQNKFGYEKAMNREVSNKTSLSNFGNSLKAMTKSGMDMQAFMNSLYGNSLTGMR